MCVPGLVLDPEVPIYAIFTSPFLADHSIRPVSTAPVVRSAADSLTHPTTNLGRKGTPLHLLPRTSLSVECGPWRACELDCACGGGNVYATGDAAELLSSGECEQWGTPRRARGE